MKAFLARSGSEEANRKIYGFRDKAIASKIALSGKEATDIEWQIASG